MLLTDVWSAARKLVPLRAYPLLAPVYRWRRRRDLERLDLDDRAYLASHPGTLVPPAELRYNVVGPYTIEQFLRSGEKTVDDIEAALGSVGRSLDDVREFLDFGCGCGRLMIALRQRRKHLKITGCDVDERAVRWCQRHLASCRSIVNAPLPPSPFEADSFDVVWCASVYTHLDENRQNLWLTEMRRILKPGGILLASVHGRHCWEPRLPAWTIATLEKKGMLFARIESDAGVHPSWYQVAWHTEEYVRRHWGQTFEIVGYRERGLSDYQDVVVARKSTSSGS